MKALMQGSLKTRRMIFLFLLCSLLFSLLTIPAEASTVASGTCGDNLTWTLNNSGTLTISGTGEMADNIYAWWDYSNTNVTADDIRNVVVCYGVTSISNYAFDNCYNLRSITISNTVTSIGYCAFFYCPHLTSITIPDSVTNIGKFAFTGCSSLRSITVSANNDYFCSEDGVLFNKNKTELIRYPAGKTNTSYTIPDSVISIGGSAFSDCSSLISVTISDNVTNIGESAFRDCSGLTNITILDGVTSIGPSAFNDCSGLTNISVSANNNSFCSEDSVLFNKDKTELICYPASKTNTTYTIPDSVIRIGVEAFKFCSDLKKIIIPSNVTSIGESAFVGCSSLYEVAYKGSPEQWKKITIKRGNEDLVNASITYTIIASGFCGGNVIWGLDYAGTLIISGTGAMSNYSYTSEPSWKSYRSSIKTVIINNGVISIGDYAFQYCSSLTGITIPDSVTSIGKEAFSYCDKLTSITIPDSVTSIGGDAFYGCKSLTSIDIPNSVTSIGSYAFSNCNQLTEIHIDSIESWLSIKYGNMLAHPNYFSANCHLYINGEELINVTIPDTFTSIGDAAFYGCSGLISVTIPDGVTSIGSYAFSNCSSLTNITVSPRNDNYSSLNGVLFDKNQTFLISYPAGKKDSSYSIPGSVISIGEDAFRNCTSLTSVTIPDGVSSVGISAFRYCSSLTSVIIPESVTNIGNFAFSDCSSLTSIIIGTSVTIIGRNAFSGCSNLEFVSYSGTTEQWNTISIADSNEPLLNANILFTTVKSISLNLTDNQIYEGLTTRAIALVTTIDNQDYENMFVSFSSSDTDLVTVDEQGNIQTFKPGTVTISATAANGVTDNCDLTVKAIQYILSLPNNLEEIESEAFAGLTAVEAIRIPEGVYYIADDAFTGTNVILLAQEGSYAANWALDHGMTVIVE